jgi:acetyl-CoA carboxylase/biotin carboxylase 1
VAVQFADLHDTPGRMAAVGVIRRAVPWAEARSFFYWRLRRRLAEFHLRKEVRSARECLIDWGSMDGP